MAEQKEMSPSTEITRSKGHNAKEALKELIEEQQRLMLLFVGIKMTKQMKQEFHDLVYRINKLELNVQKETLKLLKQKIAKQKMTLHDSR